LKKRGFLGERGGDHLASKSRQFVEESLQIFAIEFRSRIVQKQDGAQVQLVLKEPQLRHDHCHGRQLLLPAGKRLSSNSVIASKRYVCSMRTGGGSPAGSIALRVCSQRLLKGRPCQPAGRESNCDVQAPEALKGLRKARDKSFKGPLARFGYGDPVQDEFAIPG
jgi:hypothetical protein